MSPLRDVEQLEAAQLEGPTPMKPLDWARQEVLATNDRIEKVRADRAAATMKVQE